AGKSPMPEAGRDLGSLLAPSFDPADSQLASMREETIAAVLRHIGAGPRAGHVWVAADGRWQVGPLHGTWAKPEAEHIGHAAREVARRRRLADLAAEIERAEREADHLGKELEATAERERRLDGEKRAAPDGEAVRRAAGHALDARTAVIRC